MTTKLEDRERKPFYLLYADSEKLENTLHHLVLQALGVKRNIYPIWADNEEKIRLLWEQKYFTCAFLVLNSIIVPRSRNPEERIRKVLNLIPWMRKRSSALIIALSGWTTLEMVKEAVYGGADGFFSMPFPSQEVSDLLRKRFC